MRRYPPGQPPTPQSQPLPYPYRCSFRQSPYDPNRSPASAVTVACGCFSEGLVRTLKPVRPSDCVLLGIWLLRCFNFAAAPLLRVLGEGVKGRKVQVFDVEAKAARAQAGLTQK